MMSLYNARHLENLEHLFASHNRFRRFWMTVELTDDTDSLFYATDILTRSLSLLCRGPQQPDCGGGSSTGGGVRSPGRKYGVLVQRRGRPAPQQPQDQLLHEKTQVIYVINAILQTFCSSLRTYLVHLRWLFLVRVICYFIPKRARTNRLKVFS